VIAVDLLDLRGSEADAPNVLTSSAPTSLPTIKSGCCHFSRIHESSFVSFFIGQICLVMSARV